MRVVTTSNVASAFYPPRIQFAFLSEMTVSPGTRVGPYQIVAPIGAGGMGVVYKAEDIRLGRSVALKFLPEELSGDPDAVERFQREARAVSALNHPHICTVHDIGEHGGRRFIVMELLEGTALDQLIAGRPLPLDQLLDIGSAIANALEAAHVQGLIHRDIKPANVFVTQRGAAKLLDFGVAKVEPLERDTAGATAAALTGDGALVGTVAYMSPEQVRGERLDARTDLFSLGAVLYEMATGRQAFHGNTAGVVHSAILNQRPTAVGRVSPELPPELEQIIDRALEKDRNLRYQTAADLRADLQRVKRDTAPPVVTSADDARSWVQRVGRPKQVALAAAFLTLAALLIVVTRFASMPDRSDPIDSVAVLPFVNAGRDPDTDYLSDGIAESLINNLSQLPNLRVTARSAAFRYKGKENDALQIGRELRVRAIVSGRLLQRGDTLIIRAELTDVLAGSQLWGDQYDRKLNDVLVVQNDLATEIAETLRQRLSGAERRQLTKRYTDDADAFRLYLKGRYHWNRLTPDGARKALEYFTAAVDKDPAYALAYAGLAEAYNRISFFNVGDPREAMPKAKAAAAKALGIDNRLTDAHIALGYASFTYDWDWLAAGGHFERALALNRAAVVHHPFYAFYLTSVGRSDEAITIAKGALDQDPISAAASHVLAVQLALARRVDAAVEECRRTIELDPNFGVAYEVMAVLYDAKGMSQEALRAAERAVALAPRNPISVATLGHMRARSGDRLGALRILDQLAETAKQRYTPALAFAIVYAGLADADQAFVWLRRAYDERINRLAYIRRDGIWDGLRSDARFEELAQLIGAPKWQR